MGRRLKWTFLQRGQTDGKKANEKMFNTTNHSVQLLSRVRLFATP